MHMFATTDGRASRFDPVFLTDDDLDDLATYFDLDRETCRKRLQEYASRELADRWLSQRPQTSEQIIAFYRNADLYIWELMQWHASVARQPYWDALTYLTKHYPPDGGFKRVLDFGGGVGTDALFLTEAGYAVTIMDVDGPSNQFARHRCARRSLPVQFLPSSWPLPTFEDNYDVIVSFDVFEHLPDPLAGVRHLLDSALRPGGVLLQRATFFDEGDNPCHLHANISRFSGLRWHIWLAGLGLRSEGGFIYRKGGLRQRVVQRLRFLFWRTTGIWPVMVSREHHAAREPADR